MHNSSGMLFLDDLLHLLHYFLTNTMKHNQSKMSDSDLIVFNQKLPLILSCWLPHPIDLRPWCHLMEAGVQPRKTVYQGHHSCCPQTSGWESDALLCRFDSCLDPPPPSTSTLFPTLAMVIVSAVSAVCCPLVVLMYVHAHLNWVHPAVATVPVGVEWPCYIV